LVRNREAFERARDITRVAFDKTGTLTEGVFGVRGVHVPGADGGAKDLDERAVLRIAAALEFRSEHPLAEAVVAEARERGIDPAEATAFEAVAGKGVRGAV